MMRQGVAPAAWVLAGLCLAAAGCFTGDPAGPGWPLYPETSITSHVVEPRPEGGYRAHLWWFGHDIDGWVDRYRLRTIADGVPSEWASVATTDSVFVIGSGVLVRWVFQVGAVDNEGHWDATPDSFAYMIGQ